MRNNSITLAFTGASGLQYGWRLLHCLLEANRKVFLLISKAAYAVAASETEFEWSRQTSKMKTKLVESLQIDNTEQLHIFESQEWTAPIASGSSCADAMVICPCSSGTLAAIANGLSNNLIERAADVTLKEQKKLLLVPRETPLSVIHLENMLRLAKMNAVILPASPGFYHKPQTVNDLVDFVVARILDQLEIPHDLIPRWGS